VWFTAALVAVAAFASLTAAGAKAATREPIYDNIPSTLPGNVPSFGFEADGLSRFGQRVSFKQPSSQHNGQIQIVMSSWACEKGTWFEGNCSSKKKHSIKWPVTLNVEGFRITANVGIPYRPSASPICATSEFEKPGAWYDAAENRCFNGKDFVVTYVMPKHPLLPNTGVDVSVEYNTTHHGFAPVGSSACSATPQGCPYDSLNVGVILPEEGLPTVGSSGEALLINSTSAELYCGNESEVGKTEVVFCPSFYEGARLATKVAAKTL
jgi:hypothetical protein